MSAGPPYPPSTTIPAQTHKFGFSKKRALQLPWKSSDGNQDQSKQPKSQDPRPTLLKQTLRTKPSPEAVTRKQTETFTDLNDASPQQNPPDGDRKPGLFPPSTRVFNHTSEAFSAAQNNRIDGGMLERSLSHSIGGEGVAGNATQDIEAQQEIKRLRMEIQTMHNDLVKVTQQRSTAMQDLNDERQKKGSQEDLKTQVDKLLRDLLFCRETQENTELRLKTKEQEALTLCEEKESLQGKVNKLEMDLRSSQETVKQLLNNMAGWEKSYKEIQLLFQNASHELNQVKTELRTVRDDEFFRERFAKLQTDIEQWAEEHFGGKIESPGFFDQPAKEPELPTELAAICRDCRDMLKEDSTRHWIVEAYVWKVIEDNIFDSRPEEHLKGVVWAQRVRTELCILEEFLRPGIFFLIHLNILATHLPT